MLNRHRPIEEDELQRLLADSSLPNSPQRLPGHRGAAPARITAEEALDRRRLMAQCLLDQASSDQLLALFRDRFGMTDSATRQLRSKIRAMWLAEDRESRPHAKAAARRRLLTSIRKAASERDWFGVAKLEQQFLRSTRSRSRHRPSRQEEQAARLVSAVLAVLAGLDAAEVRRLIESERERIQNNDAAADKQSAP